uniref:Putative hydroxypyruvate isomerase n=1 Tax=Panagrellus redivivus TaxID=6233 RepID=A0A7E4ZT61_PANRE
MRVAANLAFMFTDVPLLQRYELAAKAGFKLVECPFPYSVPAEDLAKAATRNGLKHVLINAPCGNFEAGERGIAALPGRIDEFTESVKTAIAYAKALACPQIHVMAGVGVTTSETNAIYQANLAVANELFERESIRLLIEPCNSYSMPGYFLSSLPQAFGFLDGLTTNAKLLFDVFHVQQIHGQISALAKTYAPRIGHIQVAQVPARNEPDSPGELDYAYIFNLLNELNPDWIVGCEYLNKKSFETTAEWVPTLGLEF